MVMSFMKHFSVVSLCFFLLYAGVAWAVENCLRSNEHVGHNSAAITVPHADATSLVVTSDFPQHPAPKLHCLDSRHQIGPMLQPSSRLRLVHFTDEVSLKLPLSPGSVVSSTTKDFRLGALFEWSPSFSFLSGLSRHLFISILRI